jgi:hypothetical protein
MLPNNDAELVALGSQLDSIIQEWRAQRAREDEDEDATPWADIHPRLYPLVEKILGCTAHTTEGLAVQARAWHIGDEELFDAECVPDVSAFGAPFLAAVYRFLRVPPVDLSPVTSPAIAAPALVPAPMQEPDPIFVAIAECRNAIIAWSEAARAENVHDEQDDHRVVAARAKTGRLYEVADKAALKLLDIKPTTIAGAAALLQLASEPVVVETGWIWPENVSGEHDWFAVLSCRVGDALTEMAAA